MKIVVVTNHGNAWILECSDAKHGGMNLSDGEFVVSAMPYVEDSTYDPQSNHEKVFEAMDKVVKFSISYKCECCIGNPSAKKHDSLCVAVTNLKKLEGVG